MPMVTLSSPHDYVILFAFAGLFGSIGGIAYELTLTRKKKTGGLRVPSFDRGNYLQLGVVSSMFIGAVAAVAISYFFTPEVQVSTVVNGASVIQTKWQIVKVIPLSLIVGSSGGAFLDAMRSRALGELSAQKVATAQATARAQVEHVGRVLSKASTGQADGAPQLIADQASEPIAAATEHVEYVGAVKAAAQDVLSTNAAKTADLIDSTVNQAIAKINAIAEPLT